MTNLTIPHGTKDQDMSEELEATLRRLAKVGFGYDLTDGDKAELVRAAEAIAAWNQRDKPVVKALEWRDPGTDFEKAEPFGMLEYEVGSAEEDEAKAAAQNDFTRSVPPAWRDTMKINLNDNVKVRLTQKGRDIHRGIYDDLYRNWRNPPPYVAPEEDDEGWSEWQLWCLIQDFGPHIGMGIEPPFSLEIVVPNSKPQLDVDQLANRTPAIPRAEADAMVAAAYEDAILQMNYMRQDAAEVEAWAECGAFEEAEERLKGRIPADARAAFEQAIERSKLQSALDSLSNEIEVQKEVEQAVREAVKAETERCVQICSSHARTEWDYENAWTSGYENACEDIAAAIRAPQEPRE